MLYRRLVFKVYALLGLKTKNQLKPLIFGYLQKTKSTHYDLESGKSEKYFPHTDDNIGTEVIANFSKQPAPHRLAHRCRV